MTDISKEAKHLILLVDFIDERVNQMDGRSLYEINNSIQRLRTHILAIQARVEELEGIRIRMLNEKLSGQWHDEVFEDGRLQGLEEAAAVARDHTPNRPLQSRSTGIAIKRAIEALKEQTND